MFRKLLLLLLLVTPAHLFAQDASIVNTGLPPVVINNTVNGITLNLIDPSSGNSNGVPTGWQGFGSVNTQITCWGPGGQGYCGPGPALNSWGSLNSTMNFSYGMSTVFQDIDFEKVLNSIGNDFTITGFDFSFLAKNGNGWDDGRLDYLVSNVSFVKAGQVINSYFYDLNQNQGFWAYYNNSKNDLSYGLGEVDFIRVSFTGRDNNFWAGFYGPEVTQVSFGLDFQKVLDEVFSWKRVAGENGTFTLDEATQVRYGANGVYTTLYLEAGTYGCTNGLFGDPIGGVVKSCEIGMTELPAPDCVLEPTNPTCIIDSLTDPTSLTEEPAMYADTGSDDGSTIFDNTNTDPVVEDIAMQEELLAIESVADSADLEEMLAAVDETGDGSVEETVASSSPLANEAVAKELADSIDTKNMDAALSVVDSALAVAGAAVDGAAASAVESTGGSSSSSRSSDSSSMVASMSESGSASSEMSMEDSSGGFVDSSADAMEIFATGQMMGQAALAATAAQSEASAEESMSEAEQIAMGSITMAANEEVATQTEVVDTSMDTMTSNDVMVADMSSVESTFENTFGEQQADSSVSTDGSFAFEDFSRPVESVVAEEEAFVANLIESNKNSGDQTFGDDTSQNEAMTIAFDPNLSAANAFNVAPNMMNLEATGVLNRQEEKSDAEKRAEEVVAANQAEQEAINANYMDADQSGIVAAIGADTDFSSYRSAMLRDASAWYKPEDIYKGVVIKDNVRGSYFLEKGSTDTYKKMVEEQYK